VKRYQVTALKTPSVRVTVSREPDELPNLSMREREAEVYGAVGRLTILAPLEQQAS